MTAPFAGRRILDLSARAAQLPHALALAMAGRLLSDLGAIVSRPDAPGDLLRALPPLLPDGSSAAARFLLRGRRDEHGPFDAALGDTPSLDAAEAPIRLRISTFGPGEDPPTTETALQALSGMLAATGGHPLGGHQPAYAAGLAGFTALAALLRAGRPETADVSLFDTCCWLNWKAAATVLLLGSSAGTRDEWHTMPAKDGHVALVYMAKDWPALRDLIGDARLLEPRFATQSGRSAALGEMDAIMAPWFAARTRAEITAAAQARRVPIGPVLSPRELLQDRQHRARGFLAADGTPRLPLLWDGAAPGWRVARDSDAA